MTEGSGKPLCIGALWPGCSQEDTVRFVEGLLSENIRLRQAAGMQVPAQAVQIAAGGGSCGLDQRLRDLEIGVALLSHGARPGAPGAPIAADPQMAAKYAECKAKYKELKKDYERAKDDLKEAEKKLAAAQAAPKQDVREGIRQVIESVFPEQPAVPPAQLMELQSQLDKTGRRVRELEAEIAEKSAALAATTDGSAEIQQAYTALLSSFENVKRKCALAERERDSCFETLNLVEKRIELDDTAGAVAAIQEQQKPEEKPAEVPAVVTADDSPAAARSRLAEARAKLFIGPGSRPSDAVMSSALENWPKLSKDDRMLRFWLPYNMNFWNLMFSTTKIVLPESMRCDSTYWPAELSLQCPDERGIARRAIGKVAGAGLMGLGYGATGIAKLSTYLLGMQEQAPEELPDFTPEEDIFSRWFDRESNLTDSRGMGMDSKIAKAWLQIDLDKAGALDSATTPGALPTSMATVDGMYRMVYERYLVLMFRKALAMASETAEAARDAVGSDGEEEAFRKSEQAMGVLQKVATTLCNAAQCESRDFQRIAHKKGVNTGTKSQICQAFKAVADWDNPRKCPAAVADALKTSEAFEDVIA